MKRFISSLAAFLTNQAGSNCGIVFAFFSLVVGFTGGAFSRWNNAYMTAFNLYMSAASYGLLFVIQRTQNVGDKALNAKLDELIRTSAQASNKLIDLENEQEEDIELIKNNIKKCKQ